MFFKAIIKLFRYISLIFAHFDRLREAIFFTVSIETPEKVLKLA